MLANVHQYANLALIPANESVPIKDFLIKLKQQIPHNAKINLLLTEDFKDQETIIQFPKWLNHAELMNDLTLFEVDMTKNPEILLEHADRFVIIAEGNSTPRFSNFVKNILNQKNFAHIKKELVLVYPKPCSAPQNTKLWLDKAGFYAFIMFVLI